MNRVQAGLTAAFFVVLAGLAARTLIPQSTDGTPLLVRGPDGGYQCSAYVDHIRIPWPDGGAPDGSVCAEVDGLSSAAARAQFCLDPDGGGQDYARIRMGITLPNDAGILPPLPDGMAAKEGSETILDGGPCAYQFEAWLPSSTAEFPCACSSGANCDELLADGGWGPARIGMTHLEGQWRGAGCIRRACATYSTGSERGWPAACPKGEGP
jgi:hypothetical protein